MKIYPSLRKLAHAIYRDFFSYFQLKIFVIFLIFAQNIDCGYTLEPPRRGGSNEYPQSMFWSKNKKNRYTPAYPSKFHYIKVGFRGVFIAWRYIPDVQLTDFSAVNTNQSVQSWSFVSH